MVARLNLSYAQKFYIALAVAIVSGLVVVDGSNEARGSFGVAELVSSAIWKLAVGTPIFAVSAPLTIFYNSRRKQELDKKKISTEILAQNQAKNEKKN